MQENILMSFGQTIRKIRLSKGISQEKFADMCDLHRTYISDIELGKRNVSLENIEKMGLKKYVTIIPFIKEIESVYANIDVSLVPSTLADSFPTTILESMYFKKMVIGTRIGGIPEMIIDGVTGFIVDKNSPLELSEKISYCVIHPDEVISKGIQGKIYFDKYFSIDCFNERYMACINKLL